ncbi:MAG: pyridoxal 5'-phosphate synthase glutaminase subunit PdxT [Arachnia sp.]
MVSRGRRVGVLALQGNVGEHVAALKSVGAQPVPVRRESELASVEALIIPGGESTTIDKLLRSFGLYQPLRDRIADGMPTLGTCAGMVLLADRIVGAAAGQQTLGGIPMTVRRNAFGRQSHSFETDLSLTGISDPQRPLPAVFIRAPWVESVGEGVAVVARAAAPEGGRIVAVRYARLIATAFHPELTGDPRIHQLLLSLG